MKKIALAVERKDSKGIYTKIASRVLRGSVLSLSDFRGVAQIWTGEYIYNSKFDVPNLNFELVSEEVIARCRFLRSLDRVTANRIALRFWNGMEELFTQNNIEAVFQPMIDNYTLDIVARVAELNDIPIISYDRFFIKGYFRITTRGELNQIRNYITAEETDSVLNMLLLPEYQSKLARSQSLNSFQLNKTYYRRKVIESIYNPLMKKIEHDKYNYHYNTYILKGSSRAYISKNRYNKFISKKDLEQINYKYAIYLPLHMIPEATTDYWTSDWHNLDYEKKIINLVKSSDKQIQFLIKEHPSMDGWRNPDFYKELNKLNNVVLISPEVKSNDLLALCKYVLVQTGSVGIEALIRGKKVFTISDNYYSNLHPNIKKINYVSREDLLFKTEEFSNDDFIASLLKGAWKGNWIPGKKCGDSPIEDLVESACAFLSKTSK